jgi:hypothetical protein
VLGGVIVGMVVTWFLHVGQFPTRLRRLHTAYVVSGCLQLLLGVYLLSWCFVWLQPGQLRALWTYSTRDLLQLQHIAISCCAICCGAIEVGVGRGRLLHDQWHVLWCLNMCCVGMVFMVHPQANFDGSSTHTMLGFFIVFGAVFFLAEKWKGFPEDLYESWNIVIAGGLYLFAASLLLRFQEHPHSDAHGLMPGAAEGQHVGYDLGCHRGTPVTLACLTVAAGSGVLLVCACCAGGSAFGRRVDRCVHALHEDPVAALWRCQWGGAARAGAEPEEDGAGAAGAAARDRDLEAMVVARERPSAGGGREKPRHGGQGRYSRVEMVDAE